VEKKTGPNPTDRGTGGSKRSLLTEGQGVPVGWALDGANRHAMQLVRRTIERLVVARPAPSDEPPQGRGLDQGDDDDDGRAIVQAGGCTAHIRGRGDEAQVIKAEAGKQARRWVVERRQSWMNRFGRLLVRWDKKPEHSLAFLHFACALIAFRAAGLFG
jgi:hypothetical protein